MVSHMAGSPHTAPVFPATRWSIVVAATGEGMSARIALEELCRQYWLPLYAFARQRGFGPEDAEDTTQSFLAEVTTGGLLASADPQRGHLRTWLLAAFQHDLIDRHRRDACVRRGGTAETISMDVTGAERLLDSHCVQQIPEQCFDRAWALTTLNAAASRLGAEYNARGKSALFQVLQPFLDPEGGGDHAAAAAAARMEVNALRQAIFRLRQRFRTLLREVIADTLCQPDERLVDEEIAALKAALSAR